MTKAKNRPFGLKPVKRVDGTTWNGAVNEGKIDPNYPNPINHGDLVVLNPNSGCIELPTKDYNITFGIFQGCKYTDRKGQPVFSKAWRPNTASLDSTKVTALVCDDHNVVYEVMVSSSTKTVEGIEEKDIGSNFELFGEFRDPPDTGGAPDPVSPATKPAYGQKNPGANARLGVSGIYLDKSSKTQTIAPVRLVGLAPYADNHFAKASPVPTDLKTDGAYNIAQVTLINQAYRTTNVTDTLPSHIFLKATLLDDMENFFLTTVDRPEGQLAGFPLPFTGAIDSSGWKFPSADSAKKYTFVTPSDGTYTITVGISFSGDPRIRVLVGAFLLVLGGKNNIVNEKKIITPEDIANNGNIVFKPFYDPYDQINPAEVSVASRLNTTSNNMIGLSGTSNGIDIEASASTSIRLKKDDTFGVIFAADRAKFYDRTVKDVIGTLRGNKAGTLTYISIQKNAL